MKEVDFYYWAGSFVGLFLAFGMNIVLNWGTYFSRMVNVIFSSISFIGIIGLIIYQSKYAKRGNYDGS